MSTSSNWSSFERDNAAEDVAILAELDMEATLSTTTLEGGVDTVRSADAAKKVSSVAGFNSSEARASEEGYTRRMSVAGMGMGGVVESSHTRATDDSRKIAVSAMGSAEAVDPHSGTVFRGRSASDHLTKVSLGPTTDHRGYYERKESVLGVGSAFESVETQGFRVPNVDSSRAEMRVEAKVARSDRGLRDLRKHLQSIADCWAGIGKHMNVVLLNHMHVVLNEHFGFYLPRLWEITTPCKMDNEDEEYALELLRNVLAGECFSKKSTTGPEFVEGKSKGLFCLLAQDMQLAWSACAEAKLISEVPDFSAWRAFAASPLEQGVKGIPPPMNRSPLYAAVVPPVLVKKEVPVFLSVVQKAVLVTVQEGEGLTCGSAVRNSWVENNDLLCYVKDGTLHLRGKFTSSSAVLAEDFTVLPDAILAEAGVNTDLLLIENKLAKSSKDQSLQQQLNSLSPAEMQALKKLIAAQRKMKDGDPTLVAQSRTGQKALLPAPSDGSDGSRKDRAKGGRGTTTANTFAALAALVEEQGLGGETGSDSD